MSCKHVPLYPIPFQHVVLHPSDTCAQEYWSGFYRLLLVCKHIHGAYKTVTFDLI